MKKLSVVLFLSVAISVTAQTPHDGNHLLKECRQMIRGLEGESQNSFQRMESATCLGYIAGFLDAHEWVISVRQVQPFYCLPENGIEEGQAARIIVKWMTDHPNKLHLYDAEIMLRTLGDAFPCKNEEPSP